jgi:hypothetical protein
LLSLKRALKKGARTQEWPSIAAGEVPGTVSTQAKTIEWFAEKNGGDTFHQVQEMKISQQ